MFKRLIKTLAVVALFWGGMISSVQACPGGAMSREEKGSSTYI